MKIKALGAVMALALAGLAPAATININLVAAGGTGSTGNVLSFTNGSVTATVTSWSLANTGANFTQAATGRWGGGLGVCNATEIASCGDPQHTMDNSGGIDFILFEFNQVVNAIELQVNAYGAGGSDLSFWRGTTSGSTTLLSGQNLAGLGALGFGAQQTNAGVGSRLISLGVGNANTLLVAAKLTSADAVGDYMKLAMLGLDKPTETPIPEPATMGLMGIALAGLGAFKFRRK